MDNRQFIYDNHIFKHLDKYYKSFLIFYMSQEKYLYPISPTKSQITTSLLRKRIQISDNIINKQLSETTNYIMWPCFLCSTKIPVWYKEATPRYFYCHTCRPKAIHKPDPLLLRYMLIFTKTINQHITENSNIYKFTI